jgi:hypothetical protein
MMQQASILNITVHLANEHGVRTDPYFGSQAEHAAAHMHGRFRPGQGHYHAMPGVEVKPGA